MPTKQTALHPSQAAIKTASALTTKAKVPHIPDIVLALRTEMARPEPDLRKAADLILQDAVITGDLLKAVNSPVFNLRSKVTSVAQAASMMGVTRLTNYVTAVAVKRMVEDLDPRVRGVWEDIMEEARVFVIIARMTRKISEDEAYLFGIMHDVGALIFSSLSPDYMSEWALRANTEPQRLAEWELAYFGVNHGTLGFVLGTDWQLPNHMALAICHHHTIETLNTDDPRVPYLTALTKIAQYLVSRARGTHELEGVQTYMTEALHELDISEQDWGDLCRRAESGDWDD